MSSQHNDYSPISCEFHDRLEDLATLRKRTSVSYLDDNGVLQHRNATVKDVFNRGGAEYVLLSSGETVRLDRLVEVDGNKLSDY
ncbi:hypothetical protein Tamer19_02130 [Cupriavidus sp. TA19]|uniref:hypothetical protein n=1 Tax=unclassified Cupriavidus TaxID=2640874 RepID=UPI002729442C|nr:hypothetical protein [Cupriavidus sp. TA19]GLC90805.1 hypothetical protein Tamer19_02130 [Cupriavidus sp. TA19]